jgi:hypothetical protein
MLQVSPWWGWTVPQTHSPKRPGYVEVSTSFADPSLKVYVLPASRVLVTSEKRAFAPGEKITFGYGNGVRVDKFAEAEELFQIFVDADGDGHSACIVDPPTLRIEAGAPAEVAVSVPPIIRSGDEVTVRFAPLDGLGNWGMFPGGKYQVRVNRDGHFLEEAVLEARGGEKAIPFRFTNTEEGVYFFTVDGPSGLRGKSNAMLSQAGEPRLRLYFGDIHGHSRISDGTGTPEDFYRYAKVVSGLDIAALTDHADHGTIRVKGRVWERITKATNDAYRPGEFVTFLGFEWTNWEYGHRNVYYRDGNGPVFSALDERSRTPGKLWKLLEPYEAMTIAHHVGGGPVATNWEIVPGPREWLVEICSIHGSSEYYGAEACIYRPVKGAFARDALRRGYRLGIIGSGDTHDGHPGRRTVGAAVSGLLGVYSPELTREAVWEAFRRRHVYATSGPKIVLNLRVADAPMGSEVKWVGKKGPIPVALRALGSEDIEVIEIIRDGEMAYREKGEGVLALSSWKDTEPSPGTHWYYARVVQKDGNMAWSSPVWVTVE